MIHVQTPWLRPAGCRSTSAHAYQYMHMQQAQHTHQAHASICAMMHVSDLDNEGGTSIQRQDRAKDEDIWVRHAGDQLQSSNTAFVAIHAKCEVQNQLVRGTLMCNLSGLSEMCDLRGICVREMW